MVFDYRPTTDTRKNLTGVAGTLKKSHFHRGWPKIEIGPEKFKKPNCSHYEPRSRKQSSAVGGHALEERAPLWQACAEVVDSLRVEQKH